MSGPWSVPLVTLRFHEKDVLLPALVRYSYHVPRVGDTLSMAEGLTVVLGIVTSVVWTNDGFDVWYKP